MGKKVKVLVWEYLSPAAVRLQARALEEVIRRATARLPHWATFTFSVGGDGFIAAEATAGMVVGQGAPDARSIAAFTSDWDKSAQAFMEAIDGEIARARKEARLPSDFPLLFGPFKPLRALPVELVLTTPESKELLQFGCIETVALPYEASLPSLFVWDAQGRKQKKNRAPIADRRVRIHVGAVVTGGAASLSQVVRFEYQLHPAMEVYRVNDFHGPGEPGQQPINELVAEAHQLIAKKVARLEERFTGERRLSGADVAEVINRLAGRVGLDRLEEIDPEELPIVYRAYGHYLPYFVSGDQLLPACLMSAGESLIRIDEHYRVARQSRAAERFADLLEQGRVLPRPGRVNVVLCDGDDCDKVDLASMLFYLQAVVQQALGSGLVALKVNDQADALAQLRDLRQRGFTIGNLIIDSHGTQGGALQVGNSVYKSPLDARELAELGELIALAEGSVILNACHAARDCVTGKARPMIAQIAEHTGREVYGSASWFISMPFVFNEPRLIVGAGAALWAGLEPFLRARITQGVTFYYQELRSLRLLPEQSFGPFSVSPEGLYDWMPPMLRPGLVARTTDEIVSQIEGFYTRLLTEYWRDADEYTVPPAGLEFWDYRISERQLAYNTAGLWYRADGQGEVGVFGTLFYRPDGSIGRMAELFHHSTEGQLWRMAAEEYWRGTKYYREIKPYCREDGRLIDPSLAPR